MKKIAKNIGILMMAGIVLSSCCTVSFPVAATSNPTGTKCGETKSYVILGVFGSNGKNVGIEQASKQADITKISHVDSYVKNYFFGIVQKRTVKVYGE